MARALALLLGASIAASLAPSHASVVELDIDNYDAAVGDDHVWAVEISSSRCETCREFAPQWSGAVEQLEGVKFGHVNVDEQGGKALAKKLKALQEGIPNVKLYKSSTPVTISSGSMRTSDWLAGEISKRLQGLAKDEGGLYLKAGAAAGKGEL